MGSAFEEHTWVSDNHAANAGPLRLYVDKLVDQLEADGTDEVRKRFILPLLWNKITLLQQTFHYNNCFFFVYS